MEKDDDVATDKVSIATGIITNVKDIELTNISENDNITDAKVPDVDSTSSLPKKKKKQQKKGINTDNNGKTMPRSKISSFF